MFPNGAKRRRVKLRKSSMPLRSDRGAQHPNRVERKMRTEMRGHAVALRPSLKIRNVVTRLALNRERTRVAGRLHDRAEQNRPIHNFRSGAPRNRGQLRIREIAERTEVVVKEFDLSSHHASPASTLEPSSVKLVSNCN